MTLKQLIKCMLKIVLDGVRIHHSLSHNPLRFDIMTADDDNERVEEEGVRQADGQWTFIAQIESTDEYRNWKDVFISFFFSLFKQHFSLSIYFFLSFHPFGSFANTLG